MITTKQPPVSFIRAFVVDVQNESDFETAKIITLKAIEESYICKTSKKKMTVTVAYQIHSKAALISYLYNALQAFEGNGLIR